MVAAAASSSIEHQYFSYYHRYRPKQFDEVHASIIRIPTNPPKMPPSIFPQSLLLPSPVVVVAAVAGALVVDSSDPELVLAVVALSVDDAVDSLVGAVGASEVGSTVVGSYVGAIVGSSVGANVGSKVGSNVVGSSVGAVVGSSVGS
ncbi:MAG UNVERIFIED_CONTAM: hypothetical protein LVR18_45545 [Planctomycetaceae bacterium]